MTRGRLLCALALLLAACAPGRAADGEGPRAFTAASWQALRRAQADEPLIVHFWGLTCGPCLAELPQWGAFAARHRNARIVLVNWDRRAQAPARIAATLAKAGLGRAESWALGEGYEEKLRFGVDRDWMGELPRTELLARDGSVTAFSGAADFVRLAAWLAAQR
jgi:thiol-disulfide isomerase/thioredoxin